MKRIVIVDDHPMVRGTVASMLATDPEMQVIGECGDGEGGLKMILSETPDLAILDLDLPKLDGLSMVRRIRAQSETIRLLVLSAKPEHVMAGHTRLAGANGYVSKGRELGELLTAVRTVLLGYDCFPVEACNANRDAGLECLSPREVEVLQYLARGVSNKDIATRLYLSDKTVSTYKSRLREKLGLSSLAGMIEFATHHKLID
ncbi:MULTISPECIES: response regulator transcription factor [unclassified Paraburkholderia]|jgi:two-component system response regulator FimZ (fimbrial Z protein)|uniref:response regulator transcription factor n=1 Tax=unclassified Paraburkholderia TaxID=2615204 RepID=UPI000947326A|nr:MULTISPECIES: response regulator transcription factor [unclassified Paraburkholderia]APR37967.1 DNA-binding response regulator [Paraburkholderia sp. SOS3]MDQ7978464.1 response regulator transcription factor [Paraburkholderia sp. SARCC-3016]